MCAFMQPTAEPLLSECVCLLKRLSKAHACEHRRGILIHTSKTLENKLPHLGPRIQRVRDSRPPGLKDSSIKGLKDSSIQKLKGSQMERLRDSCLGICSKNSRARFSRTQSLDPPQSKAYEDTCSKALERKHTFGQF